MYKTFFIYSKHNNYIYQCVKLGKKCRQPEVATKQNIRSPSYFWSPPLSLLLYFLLSPAPTSAVGKTPTTDCRL